VSQLLKIAITADPELPVPPLHYGGIERIIAMLIRSYTAKGHQVGLFAHPDSMSQGVLYPYKGKSSNNKIDFVMNSWLINKTLIRENFDIVHSFGRLGYLLPQLPLSIPKIMSYQREPTIPQVKKAIQLAKKNTLAFTGCSNYISSQIAPYAPVSTVYNGVHVNDYTLQENISADAPLVFLGRIEAVKGVHLAIAIAQQTNKKLIIAGNIVPEHQLYFGEQIKPHLNEQISYIGPVNDQQKNELLGNCLAFLMPIQWDEPFGIVMIEAMACGTPVIAFRRGAVPEVVREGVTGYIVNNVAEACEKVTAVHLLDRTLVRQEASNRFDSEIIAQNYLRLYKHHIEQIYPPVQ
jgi:glycosyltransferase involved in cell wall biosynthesis